MEQDIEFKRGFNTGYSDYPGDSVYIDITPQDIAKDEWIRGYVEGFCKAREEEK
jgi:hypothetical protein